MKAKIKRPKITAKQEGGDDGFCYVIRCNGIAVVRGLTRQELAYHKKQIEAMYYENPNRFGGQYAEVKRRSSRAFC